MRAEILDTHTYTHIPGPQDPSIHTHADALIPL